VITGPLVVAVAVAVGVLALLALRARDRRRTERGEARPTPAWAWALYACAVVVGPIAWFGLWLTAFGFRGVVLDDPAAIPGWVALAIPPAIGIVLGWQLPLLRGSRNRMLLAASAPIVLVGFPILILAAGNYLALFGLAVLYVIGPIVLGRFFRLAGAVVRNRAA